MRRWALALPWIGMLVAAVVGETDFFPGLRRPPVSWVPNRGDDGSYLLAQLSSIIEEHARRRFLQQLQNQQQQQQRDALSLGDQEVGDNQPSFTYKFPVKSFKTLNDDIEFGVDPSDPRYYVDLSSTNERVANNNNNNKMPAKDDYDDVTEDDTVVQSSSDGVPYYKLKSPMRVNPKPQIDDDNLNKMAIIGGAKMQPPQYNSNSVAVGGNDYDNRNMVEQKPMDMDGIWGMYMVALIAGSSAALTVGLIGLGIAWYTLSKKAKAAADVEYPAYGITGPNKDLSPTGDRKLAQSAQMYHYQHQKQQIIAMENRSNGERNGSLSEVESDDENEEGDYTVYECPGLASTVEMEVKNPLFLDDPTPATPATMQQQPQQPQPQSQQKPKSSTSPKSEVKTENEKKK